MRPLIEQYEDAVKYEGTKEFWKYLEQQLESQYQRGIKDAIEVCEKHARKIELVKSPRGAIIQMFKELQSKLKDYEKTNNAEK